jgi:anti-sigma-K factor RskA
MTQDFDPTSSAPGDPRDDLAAYAIGALDRDERDAVERMLAADPSLRREAAEYAAAAALLNESVPRIEPPAALKGKILAAARTSRPQPALAVLPPSVPARRTRDVLAFVAGAAAVLLLALNVYWVTQYSAMSEREAELAATVARLSAEQTAVAAQPPPGSSGMEMAIALLLAPDGHQVELTSDDGSRRAMIMFDSNHTEALMVAHNLPTLDPSRTYQLWQIDSEGKAMSAGMFEPRPSGMHAMIFTPPMPWDSVSAIGISIEPAGGSETPTTTPIALGMMA